ncbi:hypothetical protein UFOVP679_11 [uncultured Caudovirales phage]|uniref:DUF551 domain-containing protein n=1 Tax=uncultured Caudovirales phage TaxID=2100421 RepID=A0A6J5NF10_9CAUD|nr:hypothetical protein UFOVP679_11 [uncultured Caudovirales phage]
MSKVHSDLTASIPTETVETAVTPGWQPIETAPKVRGVQVLLYDFALGVCVGYWPGEDDCPLSLWWIAYKTEDGLDVYGDACADYWMPLPAAPPKRPRRYVRKATK